MNAGGDAAEQVVRMSLEGAEVALKITGKAAENIAALLIAAVREENKTKGKSRLAGMLKSGKELKVFSIPQKDLKKFTKEAKKYGVLYNVIRQRGNKSPVAEIDIIARAEDAAKISRIIEKFKLATVDKAEVVRNIEKDRSLKASAEEKEAVKDTEDFILTEAGLFSDKAEKGTLQNPQPARTVRKIPSGQNYKAEQEVRTFDKDRKKEEKPSVRKKLAEHRRKIKEKRYERTGADEIGRTIKKTDKEKMKGR